MKQEIISNHFDDANGNPAGGSTYGPGLCISWQNGPLSVSGVREEPNGCFVETVIAATIDRFEYYQQGPFANGFNQEALVHLRAALDACERRTKDREARGVEGTHNV